MILGIHFYVKVEQRMQISVGLWAIIGNVWNFPELDDDGKRLGIQ